MPEEPPTITPYPDGPLLVRGPVVVIGEDGEELELRRKVVALCRCGRSRLGPLCDGTHRAASYRAAAGVSEADARAAGALGPGPARPTSGRAARTP